MKKNLFCLFACALLIAACNQQNKTATQETTAAPREEKEVFKNVAVDNTNDLVCGMPLTAGIGDTAHYNGKVYGFCSKGCKDKFVKSPTDYLSEQ